MCLYFGLCSVIRFYRPLSRSMCLHPVLCTFTQFYGPSSITHAPTSLTSTQSHGQTPSFLSAQPLRYRVCRFVILTHPCRHRAFSVNNNIVDFLFRQLAPDIL